MKIMFDNGCDIDIIPYDNEFSHMWYDEVQSVKYNIYERDRIYGFNRLYDDLDYNLLNCFFFLIIFFMKIIIQQLNPFS